MTLAERLRAAASAERLADYVRVESDEKSPVCQRVWFESPYSVFEVCAQYDGQPEPRFLVSGSSGFLAEDETAGAAIRAGLIALAEREEARG